MATLKDILNELQKNDYKKARFVLQIANSIKVKDSQPFTDFVDRILTTDVLFDWKSYPGSWKSTATHRSGLSAIKTACNNDSVINALGIDRTELFKARVASIQEWVNRNEDNFQEVRFTSKKSSQVNDDNIPVSAAQVPEEGDSVQVIEDIDGDNIDIAYMMENVNAGVIAPQSVSAPDNNSDLLSLRTIIETQTKRIQLQRFIIDKLTTYINEELRGPTLITELINKLLESDD